jgi:hypothetical protein
MVPRNGSPNINFTKKLVISPHQPKQQTNKQPFPRTTFLQVIAGLTNTFEGAGPPCTALIAMTFADSTADPVHLECPCLGLVPEDSEEAQPGGVLDCRFSPTTTETILQIVKSCHDGTHPSLNKSSYAWTESEFIPEDTDGTGNTGLIISEVVREAHFHNIFDIRMMVANFDCLVFV